MEKRNLSFGIVESEKCFVAQTFLSVPLIREAYSPEKAIDCPMPLVLMPVGAKGTGKNVRATEDGNCVTYQSLILSVILRGMMPFAALCFILSACASPALPKGGQPDKTPPKVVATEPAQHALNVQPRYIALEFNKFIQQRSQVQQNIFLTPPVKVDYSWSGGKKVFINLKERIDSNTTVALTLGTQFSDWDNVKPEAAYTLIFSTGNKLDSGIIRGKIETDKPEGLTAFLYQLPPKADTLNPSTTKPKYKTQIGSNKTLEFPALAPGAYRLFVLRDEYRNDLIDKGTDAFGVAERDITLSTGASAEAFVRMNPVEDLTAPRPVDVRLLSPTHFALRMSEKIHPASVKSSLFSLRDSLKLLGEAELPHIVAVHPDASNYAVLRCYVDKPLQSSLYRQTSTWCLEARSLRDSAGNGMADSLGSICFSTNQEFPANERLPKLVRTSVVIEGAISPFAAPNLPDSAKNVPQKPRIAFSFSDALAQNVTLATTSTANEKDIVWENASGQAVEFRRTLEQANMLVLEPRTALAPNAWYSLGFRVQSIPTWNGTPMQDSVVVLHFQTDDVRDYSGVSGIIADSVRVPLATNASISSATNASVLLVTTATARMQQIVQNATTATQKTQFVVVLEAVQQNSSSQSPSSQNSSSQANPTQNQAGITKSSSQSGSSSLGAGSQGVSVFARQRFQTRANAEGRWEFTDVPPGTYYLRAFADTNNNGRYDGGAFFPYVPAERFVQYSGEIQIRPRWTVDNVRLIVP